MGDGDARVGGRGDPGGDAGHDLERDARRAQRERLLAAAAEHERVAALQAHDAPARPGALEHQRLGLLLGHRASAALLADEQQLGVRARAVERRRRDQAVVEDHVRARRSARARARSAARGRRGPRRRGRRARPPLRAPQLPTARQLLAPARSSSPAPARRAAARRTAPAERLRQLHGSAAASSSRGPGRAVGQADPRAQFRQLARPAGTACAPERRVAARRPARARARARPAGRRTSAASVIAARRPRARARRRRAPPARACPGPGAGHEALRVEHAADLGLAAQALQAGAREHDRVAGARRVGELAQARVDVAAQRDHLEVLARGPQLRQPPHAARAHARRRARARRGGGAAQHVLGGRPRAARRAARGPRRARRARPWRSAPRGRSRPASSASSSSVDPARLVAVAGAPRSPPVVIGTARSRPACPRDAARPARAPARCAGCRCASALAARGRRRSLRTCGAGRGPRRLLRVRPPVGPSSRSPNSSRTSSRLAWPRSSPRLRRRIVGSCSRRLMTARAIASTRARSRGEADSQRAGVLGEHLLDDRVAVLAQRAHRRQRVELAQPAGEAVDLLLDDLVRPRRLLGARVEVARDHGLQVVDVVQASRPRARAQAGSMSRGHGDVDQQQRPARARSAITSSSSSRPTIGCGRGGRGEHDVGLARAAREVCSRPTTEPPKRWARLSARSAWRLATKIVPAPLLGERARGQLARLARAEDHDVALLRGRRARCSARSTATDGHAHAAGADRGLGAHALAGRQRGREQAVGERAGGAGRASPPRGRA